MVPKKASEVVFRSETFEFDIVVCNISEKYFSIILESKMVFEYVSQKYFYEVIECIFLLGTRQAHFVR